MKLSSDTRNVLANFGSINSNIVFRGGSSIKTMAEAKNVLGAADGLSEVFPDSEIGIYDLREFLSVLEMFSDPDLTFADDMNSVTISEGNQSLTYYFSDPQILTSPTKDIQMPVPEIQFALSHSDLARIRKAASTLSVSDLVIEPLSADKVNARVTDLSDSTSNSYALQLPANTVPDSMEFSIVYNVSNFKVMNTSYTVDVSSKLISRLTGTDPSGTIDLTYFIALEKNSTFGSNS